MARMETNQSILSLAVSRSNSLRTTVPIHITQKLNLEKGDVIEWDLDKVEGGRWIATIRKGQVDVK